MAKAVSLPSNEIFDAGAYLTIRREDNKTLMKDIVVANILADYKYGIKTATTENFLLDVYDRNGAIQYEWSKGEIPPINSVFLIEGKHGKSIAKNRYNNPVLWRMVGQTISYDGQPIAKREFMEINIGDLKF